MSNTYQSWDQLYSQQGFQSNLFADNSQGQNQQFSSYQNAYTNYQQQPQSQPPSSSGTPIIPSSSSLQGALQSTQNSGHSRTSSYASNSSSTSGTFPSSSGLYSSGARVTNPPVNANASYNQAGSNSAFRFGAANLPSLSLTGLASSISGGTGFTDSPTRQENGQSYYQGQQSSGFQPNAAKRQRPNTDDSKAEDSDDKADDSKDKAKPYDGLLPHHPVTNPLSHFRARACARCKNLKVRCEAKTEHEPCKRCLNGGHECFIPGRKVRRVPP